MKKDPRHIDYSYACLAAAIIKRGELENDQDFLKSDWCDTLRMMVSIAANRSNRNNNMTPVISKRRGSNE